MESTNWRHTTAIALYWCLGCIWSGLLVNMCIFIPFLIPQHYDSSEEHCAPDGSFRLESFSVVEPAWFFQVVIGFGSLDFTVAKTIDIAWDVVVGRAGQTLLAYISWKTFSKYLYSVMTTDPVTYQTFWTVFIQDGPTLRSTFRTFRDFAGVRGLRSRMAMSFIILTMAFVLAFPTLASSMTGYSASNQPWVKTDDINQVLFSEFVKAIDLYVLHDTYRVTLLVDQDVIVTAHDESWACGSADCISNYISEYGVSKPQKSKWNGMELDSPTLNISYHESIFVYDNKVYEPKYFNDRAICQPVVEHSHQKQKYQWGFSIIQLEICLFLLTIWTFGIFIMWAIAHLRFIGMGIAYNALGDFKSAVSLADAIRKELKQQCGKDIKSLTERELMSTIKTHLNGGRVMMQSPPLLSEQSASQLIRKWIIAIPVLSLSIVALVAGLIVTTATKL